jgi:hypothetical protein
VIDGTLVEEGPVGLPPQPASIASEARQRSGDFHFECDVIFQLLE